MEDPYDRLKALTRGRRVDAAGMREFVLGLGLPADAEQRPGDEPVLKPKQPRHPD